MKAQGPATGTRHMLCVVDAGHGSCKASSPIARKANVTHPSARLASALGALVSLASLEACGADSGSGTGNPDAGGASGTGGTAASGGNGSGGNAGTAASSGTGAAAGDAGLADGGGVASQEQCDELKDRHSTAYQEALACDPRLAAEQCQTEIYDAIRCGCPVLANGLNTEALAELDSLEAQWAAQECPDPPECFMGAACLYPDSASCSTDGVCVPNM